MVAARRDISGTSTTGTITIGGTAGAGVEAGVEAGAMKGAAAEEVGKMAVALLMSVTSGHLVTTTRLETAMEEMTALRIAGTTIETPVATAVAAAGTGGTKGAAGRDHCHATATVTAGAAAATGGGMMTEMEGSESSQVERVMIVTLPEEDLLPLVQLHLLLLVLGRLPHHSLLVEHGTATGTTNTVTTITTIMTTMTVQLRPSGATA